MRDIKKSDRFLAEIHDANNERQQQVVVKFVYNYIGTYGVDVHKHLEHHNLAPTLYLAKDVHRGLTMVIMEHLKFEEGIGGWKELEIFRGKLGTEEAAAAVRKKLEHIIKVLEMQKMVHADLRSMNVMIQVDGKGNIIFNDGPVLSVIDFDWSGKVGEVCYPPFLNPSIRWPEGIKSYQKIGERDDSLLLDNWWEGFVKGESD
jgi:hypothetical protein